MSHSALNQLAVQERTRREILHKSELIPPLPDLVARLLALLNKQDTEPHHLEQLMQNDQVLVAKMLAMVNSPFYGLSRPITTIREAVMVLGFRGVRSLVLATSTAKFLQRDYGCYGHGPKGLWLHAVSVAAASKHLARYCGLGQEGAELLFVGGLLHDIGKLLLAPYLVQRQVRGTADKPAEEHERELLGLDHTEAGALVTAKWNLSTEIQEVIKAHHDVSTDEATLGPALVRLADAVAHGSGIGFVAGQSPRAIVQPRDLAVAGLKPEVWDQLRGEMKTRMEESVAALANLGN